jgi:hypothetical protein
VKSVSTYVDGSIAELVGVERTGSFLRRANVAWAAVSSLARRLPHRPTPGKEPGKNVTVPTDAKEVGRVFNTKN